MKTKDILGLEKLESIFAWIIFGLFSILLAVWMLFDFEDKLAKVKVGMTKQEVVAAIGEPEKKLALNGNETWCYGVHYNTAKTEYLGVKDYNGTANLIIYFGDTDKIKYTERNKIVRLK